MSTNATSTTTVRARAKAVAALLSAVDGELASGASVTVTAEIHVPNRVRETATATRMQQTQPGESGSLAEMRNNVGTTSLETVAQGDYDGEGNSFSRELLAEPGEPDNVSTAGQSVAFVRRGPGPPVTAASGAPSVTRTAPVATAAAATRSCRWCGRWPPRAAPSPTRPRGSGCSTTWCGSAPTEASLARMGGSSESWRPAPSASWVAQGDLKAGGAFWRALSF